jgi:exonuclease SbcC
MEILSVTLKNFKAHRDRHFSFQSGINAICGENGAGKTSILEAIAWVLFNYRGAYKIEDLIGNTANTAQVTVAFLSSRDHRTYEVHRCSSRGYTLYDPQLGQQLDYHHIEEEVMPWLRQHLGVAPGTDLGRLFANTIGVPQGTFTADFLQPAERRKQVFDTILKVEEYKQAYKDTASLEKYAKGQVDLLENTIQQYDQSLTQLEPLQQRHQELVGAIAQAEATLTQLQTTLTEIQTQREVLLAEAKRVEQLANQRQTLNAQILAQQQAQAVLQDAVGRSLHAATLCDQHRSAYEIMQQAETVLQQLNQQQRQRKALATQLEATQQKLQHNQMELAKIEVKLERFTTIQIELTQLQPLIQQQLQWEQEQVALEQDLQEIHAGELAQQRLEQQLQGLREEWRKLAVEIEQLQGLAATVQEIPDLEQRRDRLQEQLSRIETARQFEAELRQLVDDSTQQCDRYQVDLKKAVDLLRSMQQAVPLLSTESLEQAFTTLAAGETLNRTLLARLKGILADLAEQVSAPQLQKQLRQLRKTLDQRYQEQAAFQGLSRKQQQQAELKTQGEQVQLLIQSSQHQLAQREPLQAKRSQLLQSLTALGNPRGRSDVLTQELQHQEKILHSHSQLQEAQIALQQAIAQLETELAVFAQLDEMLEEQQRLQAAHQPGYLLYVQHQKDAEQLPNLQAQCQEAIAQLQALQRQQEDLENQYQAALQSYDPQAFQHVENTYVATRSQIDQLLGSLPQQRTRLEELNQQLAQLQDIAEKRDRAKVELKEKEKIRRFITFARKAYKEAGPRITERYVQSISREADRLFRELLNRPNVALSWTKDYDIVVQEGTYNRRFINLSGGEQMCAALAVRLALLKVLADIDVAFFDEPTTNMDKPRRQRLAEAIANIKSFRQVFVISHDDTFEQMTENIILVEREE